MSDQSVNSPATQKFDLYSAEQQFHTAICKLSLAGVTDPTKSRGTSYDVDHGISSSEIEKVYPLGDWRTYHKENARFARQILATCIAIAIGTGIISVASGVWQATIFGAIALAGGLSFHTWMTYESYDGITDNLFQRIITKIFLNKDDKSMLVKHRKKYEDYKLLEKQYKLLVALTRQELEENGVFKVLHENGKNYGIDDDGYPVELGTVAKLTEAERRELERAEILDNKRKSLDSQIEEKVQKLKKLT